MKPTTREADADLITIVWAWADGLVTDDEARGAVILHRQARVKLAGASPTPIPTPHRSPEDIGLERGAVGVSAPDTRRACWTCRHAPTLDSCERRSYTRVMAAWIRDNIDDNLHPLPTARNCPGYEDKP